MRDARDTLKVTLRQRCFYLFCALLVLLMAVPFLEGTPQGRIVFTAMHMSVLIGVLLGVPAAAFMAMGQLSDARELVILSNAFAAAFYFVNVSYLMSYAMRRDVLTMDKLYGAAAAFLMLGVLWGYFYFILMWFHPGALTLGGEPVSRMPPSTMLFFSFVTLTTTGMSDVMPAHPLARMLCVFEMIIGVMFLAVLIARLAGTYPPKEG